MCRWVIINDIYQLVLKIETKKFTKCLFIDLKIAMINY